jgi:TonB family protein
MKKLIGLCLVLVVSSWLVAQEPPAQLGLRTFQAPEYPTVARQARIQGEVHLRLTVGGDGKIVSVESSSGPAILVAQAKSNVLQWTYTPTGQPMKLEVVYTFQLEKPETERPGAPKIRLESPVHVIISSNLPRVVG